MHARPAQARTPDPPGIEPEHALDDAIERFGHKNRPLPPAKLVTVGMAIVVELHAKRLVDRRDRALDLDAPLARVGVKYVELARLRPVLDGRELGRVGAEHRRELGLVEIAPALRRLSA